MVNERANPARRARTLAQRRAIARLPVQLALAHRVLRLPVMARQSNRPGTDDNYSIDSADERVSVMDWLLAVGHVAVRRLRSAPRSPMVRLHPNP